MTLDAEKKEEKEGRNESEKDSTTTEVDAVIREVKSQGSELNEEKN